MNRQSGPTVLAALNEAAPEPNLTVGPCTCAGRVFIECDCGGCIGRHIECRPMDPWGDTAEPVDDGRVHDVVEAERQAYVAAELHELLQPRCEATTHVSDGHGGGELGPCDAPATGTTLGQGGQRFPVCDEHAGAQGEPADIGEDDVDRVDPEDPTSMVVPVPGDRVLMADGGTARVTARRMDGDVLSLQVQRPRMGYAEWVGVEEIAGVPEPEVAGPTAVSSQAGLSAIRHGVVPTDTAAAVIAAAEAWELAIEPYDESAPNYDDAFHDLRDAVRAHRAAIGGAS